MTSFENIFDLEGAMERAAIHILGEKAGKYQQFSDEIKRTPAYEVQFDATAATGQIKIWRGLHLRREWRGQFNIRIVTLRGKNSAEHLPMLVHARIQFMQWMTIFDDVALPYHQVTFLQELPITRGYNAEMLHDWSELHFDTVFSVRDDAWLG